MFCKGSILPICKKIFIIVASLSIFSCASNNHIAVEQDPFESFNRQVYAFNEVVDNNLARPVASAYEKHVPQPIQTGLHNFFENIDDVSVTANNLLQLKIKAAANDASRLILNSTIGLLGFIDVATPLGFKKHYEDLNQTLGYWGLPDGPYIVLPLLGSYNARGFAAALLESGYLTPLRLIEDIPTQNTAYLLDFFDTRVQLLLASEILDSAALDPYSYVRESFIQRQKNLIYDGNPPEEDFDELDFLD